VQDGVNRDTVKSAANLIRRLAADARNRLPITAGPSKKLLGPRNVVHDGLKANGPDSRDHRQLKS
jgi:hypothetical protein